MSEIQVNTTDLQSGSQILKSASAEIGNVQNQISTISSSVGDAYDGQLRSIIEGIVGSSVQTGSRLQNRAVELGDELFTRAIGFEAANEAGKIAVLGASTQYMNYVQSTPTLDILSFLKKINNALSIWNITGLAIGGLLSLIFLSIKSKILPTFGETPSKPNTGFGDLIKIAEENTQSSKTQLEEKRLGSLSQKYESNGDPGRVSSGVGDIGGVSYGAYQMTSSGGGTVARFLKTNSASQWSDEFKNLTPGSNEFTEKWQEIAKRDAEKFLQAQHDYIKQTHYDPLVGKLKTINLDVEKRSSALKNVVWSTGVQHGPANNVIDNALKGSDPKNMTDVEIIRAIYAERGKKNSDGILVYFSNSSTAVQNGVANRFNHEQIDALNMLHQEQ